MDREQEHPELTGKLTSTIDGSDFEAAGRSNEKGRADEGRLTAAERTGTGRAWSYWSVGGGVRGLIGRRLDEALAITPPQIV